MAPMIKMREFSPWKVFAPSHYSKNSVFILLEPSWSASLLEHSKLSISSMNTIAGWWIAAIANIVRTIFSPSPTHFEVKVEAEIDMKVDFDWAAIALPNKVLPVPGGPKKRTP